MHQEVDALQRIVVARRVRQKLFGPKGQVQQARYTPLQKIGAGGGGIVYRAYDQKLRREVAIKLIHGIPGQQIQVERQSVHAILAEARSIASLSHPNIVAVHDVGRVVDGELVSDVDHGEDESIEAYFVVMEYVHGLDLGDWMREKKPNWAQILGVFEQAGQGLAAAHRAGLVHRDFKPANVIVGEDGRVRVIDFGLARPVSELEQQRAHKIRQPDEALAQDLLHSSETNGPDFEPRTNGAPDPNRLMQSLSAVTSPPGSRTMDSAARPVLRTWSEGSGISGARNASQDPAKGEAPQNATASAHHLAGTPAYMSPETLAGKAATPLSDQYSFCVTLYEAVFGLRPTAIEPGRAPSQLPDTLHSVPAGTPDDVAQRLARGLALSPEDRYPNLEELMRALGRGQRWSTWGIWILGLAVVVMAALTVWQARPESSCESPAFVQDIQSFERQLSKVEQIAMRPALLTSRALTQGLTEDLQLRIKSWTEQSDMECRRNHGDASGQDEQDLATHHCLDQARLSILALLEQSAQILPQASPPQLVSLRMAADTLPDPEACNTASWGQYGPEPLRNSLWHDYAQAITQAKVEYQVGRRDTAYQKAQRAWTRARAGAAVDEGIEAGILAGQAAWALHYSEDARRYFEQVYFSAVQHDRAVTQLLSAAYLVQVFESDTSQPGHLEKARWWWQQAQALAKRGVADQRALSLLLWLQHRWRHFPPLFFVAQGSSAAVSEGLELRAPDLDQGAGESYRWNYAVAYAATLWLDMESREWAPELREASAKQPAAEGARVNFAPEQLRILVNRTLGSESAVALSLERIAVVSSLALVHPGPDHLDAELKDRVQRLELEAIVRNEDPAIAVENQLLLCFYDLQRGDQRGAQEHLRQAVEMTWDEKKRRRTQIRGTTLAAMNRLHLRLNPGGDLPWSCNTETESTNPSAADSTLQHCDSDVRRAEELTQLARDTQAGSAGVASTKIDLVKTEILHVPPFSSASAVEDGEPADETFNFENAVLGTEVETVMLPPVAWRLSEWIVAESRYRLQLSWRHLSLVP